MELVVKIVLVTKLWYTEYYVLFKILYIWYINIYNNIKYNKFYFNLFI